MKISLKQLNTELKTLKPLYFIASDEPLLKQEARDTIRSKAKKEGFIEREVFHVDTHFNSNDLLHSLDNFSLFAEKTFIEIHNPKAKFDKNTQAVLAQYLINPPADKLILILTNKLTGAQQKAKWFNALESSSVFLPIWPINVQELPEWVATRMKKQKLEPHPKICQLIADLSEGNLLAAKQAIDKLSLYPGDVTPENLVQIISDNAKFNVFDLSTAALLGDTQKALHILTHLKEDGSEPTLVLWSLTQEIRLLSTLLFAVKNGENARALLAKQWKSKQPVLKAALQRITLKQTFNLLQRAHKIDKMIKGMAPGSTWDALTNLTLTLSGQRALL